MKSRVISLNRIFVVKSILVCLFLLYTFLIIDFTLIDGNFGRNISSNIFVADKARVQEYLSQKINIAPFKTVKLFINAYKNSNLEKHIVLENILGNLFVFMPFAFFVPSIFKGVNSFFKFLGVVVISVLFIEILQIVFLTGSADIDDFILNVTGAAVAYGILSISEIKLGINKFLFGEKYEIKG